MIIKIGILLLFLAIGYRLGDAAGMERGYKNCIRELKRVNMRNPEERTEEIEKGLDDIYGKEQQECL